MGFDMGEKNNCHYAFGDRLLDFYLLGRLKTKNPPLKAKADDPDGKGTNFYQRAGYFQRLQFTFFDLSMKAIKLVSKNALSYRKEFLFNSRHFILF